MTAPLAKELERIPMSHALAQTLARATEYASSQSHVEVTLEHLLLALTEDEDAEFVLASSSINVGQLKTDVANQLGRIEDRLPLDQSATTTISTSVRRILEAAAQAAQGRRNEINGAIVLAAIVGDGNSVAANLLRAQGLTFDAAIRALQSALAAPQTAPPPKSEPPVPSSANGARPTAEDLLAQARAKVQSRVTTGRQGQHEKAPEPQAYPVETQAAPQGLESDDASVPQADHSLEPFDRKHSSQPENAPLPPEAPKAAPQPAERTHQAVPRPAPDSWAPPQTARAPGAPPQQPRPLRPPPPLPTHVTTGPPPAPAQQHAGAPQRPQAPNQPPRPHPQNAQPPPAQTSGRPANRPGPPAAPPPWQNQNETTQGRPPQRPARRDRTQPPTRKRQLSMTEPGQLVENIPRAMKVGVATMVEASIGHVEIKDLADQLRGPNPAHRHQLTITKAMSVRLRAPDGGFFIETASPETQWISNQLGNDAEDFARWRWNITPKARGSRRLHMIVSARTVGADGLAADTMLPDQVVEVKVRTNYARTARKVAGWTAAAVIGGLLARFGEGLWESTRALVQTFSGGA